MVSSHLLCCVSVCIQPCISSGSTLSIFFLSQISGGQVMVKFNTTNANLQVTFSTPQQIYHYTSYGPSSHGQAIGSPKALPNLSVPDWSPKTLNPIGPSRFAKPTVLVTGSPKAVEQHRYDHQQIQHVDLTGRHRVSAILTSNSNLPNKNPSSIVYIYIIYI